MSRQFWNETLAFAEGSGSPLTNSSSATSVIPAGALITLPNNYWDIGRVMRITVVGQISNVVTTPGTWTPDIRFGAVIAFNGGAMQMSTTVHTNLPVWYEILLTGRAIGQSTSANVFGQGYVMGQPISFTNSADLSTSNSVGSGMLPNTTPAAGTGFNSTSALTLDHFVTFSGVTATTSYTLSQFVVEALN